MCRHARVQPPPRFLCAVEATGDRALKKTFAACRQGQQRRFAKDRIILAYEERTAAQRRRLPPLGVPFATPVAAGVRDTTRS